MVTSTKGAIAELYASVYAILIADSELRALLNATTPDDRKIFQSYVDFETAHALKLDCWVTFHSVNDEPYDIEQSQDVQIITLDLNVWCRGPGSDPADDIHKRVMQLIDDANLNTSTLFSWYCQFANYQKTWEPMPQLWHVTGTFKVMCMAIIPEA